MHRLVLWTAANLHPRLPGHDISVFPGRLAAPSPTPPSSGQVHCAWTPAHQAASPSLSLPKSRRCTENRPNLPGLPPDCFCRKTRFTRHPGLPNLVHTNDCWRRQLAALRTRGRCSLGVQVLCSRGPWQ